MAHKPADGGTPAVQRGHEIFDLDLRYVRWFSLIIVVLLIVTAAVAYHLMGGFRIDNPATAPSAETSAPAPFATLQNAPQQDLRTYRRDKAASLEGYRWADRKDGVVQIPIERAMELVAAPRPEP
ncbi:MAG: hypothetical protein ACHQIO_08805, partial [Nevskiales bacterium]